jgi:YgiT-type zinc finger domain-containing protein
MTLKHCPECRRASVRVVQVDRRYRVQGRERVVRCVPAQECAHCGAMFFDLGARRYIERALGLGSRRAQRSQRTGVRAPYQPSTFGR